MSEIYDVTRRRFIQTTMVAAGAAALPFGSVAAQSQYGGSAKYTRYNVMSPPGQKALASYAKGVQAMLNLPADHPQNWFRNSFIHLMDCPHGNWWFYVWHRGYVGYFEETIRNLSGDADFAMPYWDWTTLPRIPDSMFDGVLDPRDHAFEPYTNNLAVFKSFLYDPLKSYWGSLSAAQLAQLKVRGYPDFDTLWNDVNGYSPSAQNGISGNIAYATTCASRYLSRGNPHLDPKTSFDVSPLVILAGLLPIDFYNSNPVLSFTSSKTPSHNTAPSSATKFSTLEGLPHNKVHNCIGGVGPLDPGPYGNMTNFLSPVDPIFFLHHANMDRLWDVWTRKQQLLKLPILPSGSDLTTLSDEPFLFYVNGAGNYVGPTVASDFFSTAKFDYKYASGFTEELAVAAVDAVLLKAKPQKKASLKAQVQGSAATLTIPRAAVTEHLASDVPSLLVEVTVERPHDSFHSREYDVIVGAPPTVTRVDADSPYYAGTIAFFGVMPHDMHGSHDATFVVPLPKRREAYAGLEGAQVPLTIRVVPSQEKGKPAPLKAATVHQVQ